MQVPEPEPDQLNQTMVLKDKYIPPESPSVYIYKLILYLHLPIVSRNSSYGNSDTYHNRAESDAGYDVDIDTDTSWESDWHSDPGGIYHPQRILINL